MLVSGYRLCEPKHLNGWPCSRHNGKNFGQGLLIAAFLLSFLVLAGTTAKAQQVSQADLELLSYPFEPEKFRPDEIRLLQLELAAEGVYSGLIDGFWGEGSDQAMSQLFTKYEWDDANGVQYMHAAAAAALAFTYIDHFSLDYHLAADGFYQILLPPEGLTANKGDTQSEFISDQISVEVFFWDADQTIDLHKTAEQVMTDPYVYRSPKVLVTGGGGDLLFHMRSDLQENGQWSTVRISSPIDSSAIYNIVASSVVTAYGTTEQLRITPGEGLLSRLTSIYARLDSASNSGQAGSGNVPADTSAAEIQRSSGTAFYVNNYDMVTAAHVVAGCNQMSTVDGDPLEVTSIHPTLDLALLRSQERSRDWIPLDQTGEARLGVRVFALGYPFFGTFGTSLTMTSGEVSAVRGLNDDPSSITISAAIQPGNSGGPVISSRGAILGVVTSTYDKIAVANQGGVIPENTNFAVAGPPLLSYLRSEGVVFLNGGDELLDLTDGLPLGMQEAVRPVICTRLAE